MLRYIGKRILLFFPTLFIITLLGFVIAVNAPGDPVAKMMTAATATGDLTSQSSSMNEQKLLWRKKLGLDLPVFYFSISNLSTPDTLYKIYDKDENMAAARLLDQYGNWEQIQSYYMSCDNFYRGAAQMNLDTAGMDEQKINAGMERLNTLIMESKALKSCYDEDIIQSKLATIGSILSPVSHSEKIRRAFDEVWQSHDAMTSATSKWKNYIPAIHFYGTKNQYHRWLFGDGEFSQGLVRFDFGTSYSSKLPISDILKSKIAWSLFFTLFSVILAYGVSIPLGVRAARKRNGFFDRGSSLLLFILYSLPNFFVAFLLMLLFSNPNIWSVLPASGVKPAEGYPEAAGFFECVKISLPYVIMPLICYTYSSFAFLSRTVRGAMIENLEQDYIRTAHAKGLPEKRVIWKHAFRNSLLPVITVFANVFPAAIGGSVILESIFTIPGMGLEVFNAIAGQDYPMIIAVMTLTGILTLIGFLISDILYAVVDPRINYG
ncbi:MAG: ABC-type transporter, integral rane subunit [Bacteroidetes bacterium]|jgi:peptide/nickel transport system permease protein|nr:ABC-type transporter, integral rane subunit [Bacteroidota bacterium]